MATLNKETKITITILTAVVVAFIGYRFLEDLPIFQQTQVVYTYFDQVSGLTVGSYIYMSGVKVGSVRGFKLVENKDKVRVKLGFNPGMTVTKGAVAVLKSTGLLGGKAIYIRDGRGNQKVPEGGTIPGVYESGIVQTFTEEAESIAGDASETFNRINAIIAQVQEIVDEENQRKINLLLTNLKEASQEIAVLLEQKRQELASSIEHANDFLANLDTLTTQNQAAIDSAITNFKQTMANLEEVSSELDKTTTRLNSILMKINEGKGTLGKLVNDSSLYTNIDSLASELEQLIENMNEQPGKYLKHLDIIEVF